MVSYGSGGGSAVELPFEKTVDSDTKLRVRFVPVETGEHVIEIADNGKPIEGFPVKINVFQNKDTYVRVANPSGTRLGSSVKFDVVFGQPVENVNIKITSNY